MGNRLFAVADPRMWNLLPALLHLVNNYTRFRRLLKALLTEASARSDVLF